MAKKENPKKNKHLLLEDRKEIEECLEKRMTFKAIGKLIQKDPTTVSYEVKHHRSEHRRLCATAVQRNILLRVTMYVITIAAAPLSPNTRLCLQMRGKGHR